MKALELLKEKLKLQNQYKGVSGMKPFIKETEEAIKELEDLQNRKCINCKFSSVRFNIDCNLINKLDLPDFFCCNRWTQK